MITKEKFKEIMNKLIELKKAEDLVDSALKKLDPDFGGFALCKYESLIVECLELTCNDDENHWISYWLYDLDCGKEAKRNSVTINKKNIPIKTVDDLYKILINKN
jgi:hypothetical protein